MNKRRSMTSRSGPWVYIALAIVLYVLGSLAYGLATSGSACGDFNSAKEWRYIPPGWDCPSPEF